MDEIIIDLDEIREIFKDLKALTSLLFALSDAESGGFIVDGESLNHLGSLASSCNKRLHEVLKMVLVK